MFIYGLRIWLSLHHTSFFLFLHSFRFSVLALCFVLAFFSNFRCRQEQKQWFTILHRIKKRSKMFKWATQLTYCRVKDTAAKTKNLNQGKERETVWDKVKSSLTKNRTVLCDTCLMPMQICCLFYSLLMYSLSHSLSLSIQ